MASAAHSIASAAAEVATPRDRDFYAILKIPRTATHAELKHAYRKAAIRMYPSKPPPDEDERKWKDIDDAYEILIDTTSRAIYDREGEEGIKKMKEGDPTLHDPALHDYFFGEKKAESCAVDAKSDI